LLRRRTGLSLGEALGLELLILVDRLIVALARRARPRLRLSRRRDTADAHADRARRARDRRVLRRRRAGAHARVARSARARARLLDLRRAAPAVVRGRLAELFTLRALFSACFVAGCASAFAGLRHRADRPRA
jgi:hypothetical protein